MGHISCLFNCRVEWGLHIELGNTLVLLHIFYPFPPPDRSNGSPLVWSFIIWCGFCFHIRQQSRSRVTINVTNSLSHVKWHLGNKMCTWNVYTTSTHTLTQWLAYSHPACRHMPHSTKLWAGTLITDILTHLLAPRYEHMDVWQYPASADYTASGKKKKKKMKSLIKTG